MANDRTQYQCPVCSVDMTDQVHEQCALSVSRPMVVEVGETRSKGAQAAQVMLQCPKGHWAEYPCPKTGQGES